MPQVSLKNNDLQTTALQAVAEMISVNTKIAELDLTANFAGDAVCEFIAEGLTMNKTLKSLNMDNCQVDDKGAKAILAALPKSKVATFSGYNNAVLDKETRKAFRGFSK